MQTFADQLVAARKAAGMTQEQLAEAVHVARNTVSYWEHGRSLPDVEMLRSLGQTLNCDFLSNPATAAAETAAQTAEAVPETRRRRWIPWAAAALAVVVLCAGLLIFLPRQAQPKGVYTSASGETYAIADYQAVAPQQAGKAYLTVTPQLRIETAGSGYFMYSFILRESNGVPFTIQRTECVQFFSNGVGADVFTGDELRAFEMDPDIPALGVLEYEGGQPAKTPNGDVNGIGVGFRVTGVDAGGEQLTFTGYLPFPQEL